MPLAKQSLTHTGQQLGNYHLTRLLGRGGFAEVYLGEHVYLKTQAAIKVLQTQLTSDDQESFLREARTLAQLEHPHIVPVLEFGIEGATPYLVMDYAPNGSLRQKHPQSTLLAPAQIVSYVKQMTAALQYTHSQQLIYRDLKPENVLLGRNGEVLLSDFGLALAVQGLHPHDRVVGTVAYMAPEQLQGRPCPASDEYALGVIVYEWVCGERPFQGSFAEIATQHALVPPPPLSKRVSGLSPLVEEVVSIALAKDPRCRFASVKAFATALEQACQEQLTPITRTFSVSFPHTASDQPFPRQTRLLSRRTVVGTLAAVAGVAGVGGIVAWATHRTLPSTGKRTSSRTAVYTYHNHAGPVNRVTWLPGGQRIASSSDSDGTLQIWDATTGDHSHIYGDRSAPPGSLDVATSQTWSPDYHSIALVKPVDTVSYQAQAVQVWTAPPVTEQSKNAPTMHLIFTYRGHSTLVNALAWSPDSKRIASAGGDDQGSTPDQEHDVQVWDATSGQHAYTYQGHRSSVRAVAWSPDGKYIASVCGDTVLGTVSTTFDVQVWDAQTGQKRLTYPAKINAVAWSPNSQRIATAHVDGTVQVWDAPHAGDAATRHHLLIYHGHTSEVSALAWSPDSTHIASGSADKTVQIWNSTTGQTMFTYRGHFGTVTALAWSPNGKLIASGSEDTTVQVWDAV